ncbi:MAG: hypothetical protein OHK0012_16340 [Synechococcales cyanobacterium]
MTFYLPPELHHHLKIQAAVEAEAMSTLAERALRFYLDHNDVVIGTLGASHQVHQCPACAHPFTVRHGQVQSLPQASSVLIEGEDLATWEAEKALVHC